MREAFNRLNADDKHILSDISVNPVYKQLLATSLHQARVDSLALNPDDEFFNAKYRALQFHIDFLQEAIAMNEQLFRQFYQATQATDKE